MRHLIPSVPEANAVLPVILERPRAHTAKLEDPTTSAQVTIATLIAQVDHLKAENQTLKYRLRDLQDRLDLQGNRDAQPVEIPVLPPRRAIAFHRNAQGHYVRDHVWAIKEHHTMVKICMATLKWLGLFTFGFTLAMLLAFGFNQMAVVEVMIQLAQHIWKPIAMVGLLTVAIAWFTEAV